MLLPVLSAILGIIAFLPENLWFFGFFFLVPFFIFLLKENSLHKLLAGTLLFRLIFSLGTVYYALEPIAWILSLLIFLGLPILVFLLKIFFKKLSNFKECGIMFVFLPFLWALFDRLQAEFSPLPTYIITAGNIFGSSPYLGLANFAGGLIFLIFFSAAINSLFAASMTNLNKSKINGAITASMAIFIIAASWTISQIQLKKNAAAYENLKNSLKIAAVSVDDKFSLRDIPELKNDLSDKNIELIIFPEDMLNDFSDSGQSIDVLKKLAKSLSKNLVITIDSNQNNKKFNSSILINKNGEITDIYNKNKLAFMGEYWPFKNWRPSYLNWAANINPKMKNYAVFNPQNSYSKGEIKNIYLKEKNVYFASLICLEMHYFDDISKYKNLNDVKFIISPSSNRWINKGERQFLFLANNLKKIESVWYKLPIASSGVKDFSGITYPSGKMNANDAEFKEKKYSVFIDEIKF